MQMKELLDYYTKNVEKALQEINFNFIKLEANEIVIKSKLDEKVSIQIKPDFLGEFIKNAILPVICRYDFQIIQSTDQQRYTLKLLDSKSLEDNTQNIIRFIDVLAKQMRKEFYKNDLEQQDLFLESLFEIVFRELINTYDCELLNDRLEEYKNDEVVAKIIKKIIGHKSKKVDQTQLKKFVVQELQLFQDSYDQLIHETIKKIKKLQKLDNQKILSQVADGVKQLEAHLTDYSKNEVNDLSIDANDKLNFMMDKLTDLPQIFIKGQHLNADWLQTNIRSVARLSDIRLLFAMGLRDICEKVLNQQIITFSYEEIEQIVEARFEDTQLRSSLLKQIQKALQSESFKQQFKKGDKKM
eukprot:403357036